MRDVYVGLGQHQHRSREMPGYRNYRICNISHRPGIGVPAEWLDSGDVFTRGAMARIHTGQ